jgi:hypothetical protein
LSFMFVIVCDLFNWKLICAGFYRLLICVLPLEIQLSRGEGRGPINRFKPVSLFDLWLFRSFYLRRSSAENLVERDFFN